MTFSHALAQEGVSLEQRGHHAIARTICSSPNCNNDFVHNNPTWTEGVLKRLRNHGWTRHGSKWVCNTCSTRGAQPNRLASTTLGTKIEDAILVRKSENSAIPKPAAYHSRFIEDLRRQPGTEEVGIECLEAIFQQVVVGSLTIGEAVDTLMAKTSDSPAEIESSLREWGLNTDPEKGLVKIGTNHPGIETILVSTPFSSGWSKFLLKIAGSVPCQTGSMYYEGKSRSMSTTALYRSAADAEAVRKAFNSRRATWASAPGQKSRIANKSPDAGNAEPKPTMKTELATSSKLSQPSVHAAAAPMLEKVVSPGPSTAEVSPAPAVHTPPPAAAVDIHPRKFREIMSLLETYFDDKKGLYVSGYSDDRVARDLDLPRVAVEYARRTFFGELKTPPEILEAMKDLDAAVKEGAKLHKAIEQNNETVAALQSRIQRLADKYK